MGHESECATAEPTVVHTSHRYRLTAIHLSPYPLRRIRVRRYLWFDM